MTSYKTSSGAVATTTTSTAVSRLAKDARRVLGGRGDAVEALEVLDRIDALMAEWREVPNAPIYIWLKNLRQKFGRG